MTNTDNRQTFLARLLLITACLLTASCADMQMLLDDRTGTPRPLAYYSWLESADRDTLDREQQRLAARRDDRNPRITLIQRALLYSVPTGGEDASGTAREMLTIALQEREGDAQAGGALLEEYTAFARIWLTLLEQKQEYQSAQANQLSDQDRIRDLSVKVDRLEKQIEALTTIEQRLIRREQTQGQTR